MQELRNIANGLRGQKGKVNVAKRHAEALGIPCPGASVMHDREDLVKRVDGKTDEAISQERGPSALESENAELRRQLAELQRENSSAADLSGMTVSQLTELAEAEGIDLGSATKKADIIYEIETAREIKAAENG